MSDAGTGPGGPQALGPDTTAVTAVTASGKRISTTSLIAIIVIVCLVILIVIATAVAVTLSRVKENAKPANIPLSERLSGKHLRIVPQNRVSCSKLPPGIKRTVVSNSPIVDLLSGVLTQEQCEHLIALANPRFKRSVVVEPTTGAFVENKDRTSSTVFLDRDETPVVKDIQARVSQAAGMPVAYLERLQVVRYKPGQFYKPHFDYLEASTQDVVDHGQRVITVFAYLNDLDEGETGGGTHFPHLDITVKPEMGKAALWHDVTSSGNVDPRTLHGGQALDSSTKYGLNCWWRDKPQVKAH
jgi:prolyl 4-hydroxylase